MLALEIITEQYHVAAHEHWRAFSRQRHRPRLVTTSYVFDEVVTLLNSRGHHARALDVGGRLLESPTVDLVHVDEDLFLAGWGLLSDRPDKRFSLTDCISFVLMRRRGMREALSFDSDFA
ncbi:MAG TPA: PIN domain-containing protein, partial [Longimicrobiaceae bacterium]|nr:PIN domain-containing protein [Longimicrobiaceae bacterium]